MLVAVVVAPFLNPGTPPLFFAFMTLPMALILDAALYPLVHTSPGKALLGLRLVRKDGSRLSAWQYLERNLSLWASGLAFGLPIIFLFTLVRQSFRLGKGRAASYDEDSGFEVRASPPSPTRKAAFGVLFVATYMGALALAVAVFKRQPSTTKFVNASYSAFGKPRRSPFSGFAASAFRKTRAEGSGLRKSARGSPIGSRVPIAPGLRSRRRLQRTFRSPRSF